MTRMGSAMATRMPAGRNASRTFSNVHPDYMPHSQANILTHHDLPQQIDTKLSKGITHTTANPSH